MEKYINSAPLTIVLILLAVGFVFLVKGADLFVDGSSSVAKRFKVPSLIIGLTIVAMGTSLPETAVSVTAALEGKNTLAVSNVTGSNIFNLMVVIGFCAIMTSITVDKATLFRDFPICLLSSVLLLVAGYMGMSIGRAEAVIFLVIFAGYMVFLLKSALKDRNSESEETEQIDILSIPKSIIFIIIGIAGIAVGGDLVVDTASRVAIDVGMSETLVGLTIVSIGTSLPELVTSIVAARKKEVDMALGNAIGSCIFNILLVLGIAAAISPIVLIQENIIDIMVLIGYTLVVWLLSWTRRNIKRIEGIIMVALYIAYSAYIIIR